MTVKEVAKMKLDLYEFKRPRNPEEYKHFIQAAVIREAVTVAEIGDILDYYDKHVTERAKTWKGILREGFVGGAICQRMVDPEMGSLEYAIEVAVEMAGS